MQGMFFHRAKEDVSIGFETLAGEWKVDFGPPGVPEDLSPGSFELGEAFRGKHVDFGTSLFAQGDYPLRDCKAVQGKHTTCPEHHRWIRLRRLWNA